MTPTRRHDHAAPGRPRTRPARPLIRRLVAAAASAALSAAVVAGGCVRESGKAAPATPTTAQVGTLDVVPVRLKGTSLKLEFRATHHARHASIKTFPQDPAQADGELLVYPIARPAQLHWEGNPPPLEVVSLDDAGRVVGVEPVVIGPSPFGRDKPGSGFVATAVARYALLLRGGTAKAAGVAVGDTVEVPRRAADAAAAALVPVTISGQRFRLEVAATELGRNHGLMRVPSLPVDVGMAFVFAAEQPLSFWMRNTIIPLDIVYLDDAGRVVSAHTMNAMDDSPVPSGGMAKYAIELQAGTAERIGVRKGELIGLPPAITNPPDLE
ncbi:MAG TPA: DUF192 domain-containing protein [Humisphaera sp.]